MSKINTDEYEYLNLEKYVLEHGNQKGDRTGTGTLSTFGYQMRFDLSKGFPLLTTKSVPFRLIKSELLWFLHGDTNIKYLLENNNHIWDEWAFKNWVNSDEYEGPDMTNFALRSREDPEFKKDYLAQKDLFCQMILNNEEFAIKWGNLGDVYGAQWRQWKTDDGRVIDQISNVIENIKHNPNSRRLIVSAWNPGSVDNVALPPCHSLFQFYVCDGKLSCQLYQRSADIFLGVPFNIASYALLTSLIAKECGLEVGDFIHTLGDAHIYNNLIDQVKEQISREPYEEPKLWLNPDKKSIFEYDMDDIKVLDYKHHSRIKGNVSV